MLKMRTSVHVLLKVHSGMIVKRSNSATASAMVERNLNENIKHSLIEVKPELSSIREKMQENAISRYKEIQNKPVSFWETERGIEIKEKTLKETGRVLRLFVSTERYNNMNESYLRFETIYMKRLNEYDKMASKENGKIFAGSKTVMNLGGAISVRYDNTWIDDLAKLRIPSKEHFKIEAIDLRMTRINFAGLQLLEGQHYLRYLNVADCPHFNDFCMAELHPVHDCLEYLDISGTQVTEKGFGYLRMFSVLRWLNLSRLKKCNVVPLLPFIAEILPPDCAIIVDDMFPAEVYGIDSSRRNVLNPMKDELLPKDHPKIGDLDPQSNVVLYDPVDVHTLWQLPSINKGRNRILKDKYHFPLQSFHKYIKRAENQPPIF